jgi:hypothetical protein
VKLIHTPETPLRLPDTPPFPNPAGETPTITPPMIVVREKPKWEYKRIVQDLARDESPSEDELNRLGAEGWELAAVVQDSPLVYLYFKRATR